MKGNTCPKQCRAYFVKGVEEYLHPAMMIYL
jgi:hypothetical protein